MNHRRKWGIRVFVALILCSFADGLGECSKDGKGEWFFPALSSAPAVISYSHRIKGKWTWFEDGVEGNDLIVAVGEDFPDHVARGLTAKVCHNGAVYILEYDKNGEEWWRLDRPPDKKGQ